MDNFTLSQQWYSTPITNADLNWYYNDEVQMSRDNTKHSVSIVMPIINDILKEINKQDRRFGGQALCTGSYYQGLKVDRADEFDINVPILGVDDMHWAPRESLYFTVKDNKVQRINVPLPPPELDYTEVRFGSPTYPIWQNNDMRFDGYLIPFLVKKRFRELFRDALEASGHRDVVSMSQWKNGPALTFTVKDPRHHHISVDFAPLLSQPKLPLPSQVQWPHYNTRWPSEEKKVKVKEMGVNFVAKKDIYWYISFGHMEKELIRNIDEDGGCRKRLQRIMKKMRDDIWCPGYKPALSSYHLKNLLFWECESHPSSSEWTQEKMQERFHSAVRSLLKALREKKLPQFFQPKVNLLDVKDQSQARKLDNVMSNIETFLGNPSEYFK